MNYLKMLSHFAAYFLLSSFLFLIPAFAQLNSGLNPIVQTEQGAIEGKLESGVEVYRGIPFAAPPVGNLRWRAPQAPAIRNQVLKAFKNGAKSLQVNLITQQVSGSEDCLYLNIWAPKNPTGEKLPVMVWIHGGAFIFGEGNTKLGPVEMYDAKALVNQGKVIVVTINYRLGLMGYLAHPDLAKESKDGSTGNYGTLDQIAALKWVQANIENFGGSKENVTIFGESAGAVSVLALLASPLAKGLFSKAIVQSGLLVELAREKAMQIGLKIADRFKSPEKKKISVTELRRLDAKNLTKRTQIEMINPASNEVLINYAPTIDGSVLKYGILETIQRGKHNQVPVMIGSNADEIKVLGPIFFRSLPKKLSREEFKKIIVDILNVSTSAAEEVVKQYSEQRFGSYRKALEIFSNDAMFHLPAQEIVAALEKHQPKKNFRYLFTQKVNFFGAGHGMEILYLFPNRSQYVATYNPISWNPLKAPMNLLKQHKFTAQMLSYWTNFANESNPNGREADSSRLPFWPTASQDRILELTGAKPPAEMNGYRSNAMRYLKSSFQVKDAAALKCLNLFR